MRVIGWIILAFFVLVLINYGLTIAANFAHAGQGSDQLSSIDFSFFGKNGVGWSYITQGYGRTPFSYAYIGDWHNGIDIAAAYGAPIYAPGMGTVLATGDQDNYCPHLAFGKFVVVDDAMNHLVLLFAHLGTIAVSPDSMVKKGRSSARLAPPALKPVRTFTSPFLRREDFL